MNLLGDKNLGVVSSHTLPSVILSTVLLAQKVGELVVTETMWTSLVKLPTTKEYSISLQLGIENNGNSQVFLGILSESPTESSPHDSRMIYVGHIN